MCTRRRYAPTTQLASDAPYEGQTTRLDLREQRWNKRCAAGHSWGFSWRALWLIWPLIVLAKWVTPLALGMLAIVTDSLGERGALIVAVLLIVAGIGLLRQN